MSGGIFPGTVEIVGHYIEEIDVLLQSFKVEVRNLVVSCR